MAILTQIMNVAAIIVEASSDTTMDIDRTKECIADGLPWENAKNQATA